MKKIMIMMAALCMGALTSFGQAKPAAPKATTAPAPQAKSAPSIKDTVFLDESFEDAGEDVPTKIEYHLAPKYYKPGELAVEQPIALSTAKKEAVGLARSRPSPLRRDCINVIYTVDPIYSDGTITGAVKGTIVIKWEPIRKVWVYNYLKYQLINVDQAACVFLYEAK